MVSGVMRWKGMLPLHAAWRGRRRRCRCRLIVRSLGALRALLRMTRFFGDLTLLRFSTTQLPKYSINFSPPSDPSFLLRRCFSIENLEEVITPCAGRQSRAIRVSVLVSPASDAPTVPSRLWGPRVFLGPRGFASGTYDVHSRAGRFLGKGCSSQIQNKLCGKLLRCGAKLPSIPKSDVILNSGEAGVRDGTTAWGLMRRRECSRRTYRGGPFPRSCRWKGFVRSLGALCALLRMTSSFSIRHSTRGLHSTFQPLTSTVGFVVPSSLAL